jgi:hypothetical protein
MSGPPIGPRPRANRFLRSGGGRMVGRTRCRRGTGRRLRRSPHRRHRPTGSPTSSRRPPPNAMGRSMAFSPSANGSRIGWAPRRPDAPEHWPSDSRANRTSYFPAHGGIPRRLAKGFTPPRDRARDGRHGYLERVLTIEDADLIADRHDEQSRLLVVTHRGHQDILPRPRPSW